MTPTLLTYYKETVVPALQESAMVPNAEPSVVMATKDGDDFLLTGTKRFVPCAADADGFLINAAGADGTVVAYVPSDVAEIATTNTVDGGGWGDVSLAGAKVSTENIIAGPNRAPELAAHLIDSMLIVLGAELLGVAALHPPTYVLTRNSHTDDIRAFLAERDLEEYDPLG